MYERLREVGRELPLHEGDVLAISRSRDLLSRLGISPRSVTEANYPEENLLGLSFANESFDFVLSDQVLEHLEGDPQRAFDESWRVLRPGGIVVHTTVFIYPVHGSPGDFWRFTPDGLRLLASRFNRIVECGGWGNFEAWKLLRRGIPSGIGVPHATWHPLHRLATRNDPEWPMMTWIVAQK
jgi:SAM-dependent methyltransferase